MTLQGNNNRLFIKTLTFGNNWVIILTQFTEINNYTSILLFKDINLLKQKVLINSQNFVFQKFKEFVKHLVPNFLPKFNIQFFLPPEMPQSKQSFNSLSAFQFWVEASWD